MRLAMTGASGLIGSALAPRLREAGHEIVRLTRGSGGEDTATWDPLGGTVDTARLDGLDGVVHLAGESVAGLWTAGKKRRIRDSRVVGTRTVCQALARLPHPPAIFIGASAIGYYGSRSEAVLTEQSPPGEGFLAETCQQWEEAVAPLAARGTRIVHARFALVLDRHGGALKQMLPIFKCGLGGRLGDGRQYVSWITRPDAVRAVHFAIDNPSLHGPVNIVAPHPVTNAEWTRCLARQLGRPAVMHVPAWALKALAGEMAREMLLSSVRVFPQRLQSAGFHFHHEELEEALAALLS